jgi:hypothetical protein
MTTQHGYRLTNLTAHAEYAVVVDAENPKGYIKVSVTWSREGAHLDRTDGQGFGLPTTSRGFLLANRLVRAINAQQVFGDPSIAVDRNGKTYVASLSRVSGRHMHKDLWLLGF